MEKKSLLRSKHYGLGKYKLWRLNNHSVIKRLGYSPPKTDLHTNLYDHQNEIGDIFVSAALTGKLLEWKSEVALTKYLRTDIVMRFSDLDIYVEVERGNQTKWKLKAKIENYIKYYQQTQQYFYVLFVVADDIFDDVCNLFDEMQVRQMYMLVRKTPFETDILNTPLQSRNVSHTLTQLCINADTE